MNSNQLDRQKILIVDDTPEYIDILMGLLRSEYKVVAARSGAAALKIAESSNPPDLVLLDVVMPDMDGHEVCSRLKSSKVTRNIPVIFLTAKDEEESETEGLNLGAVDYITKPIVPAIVKSRVKTHLSLKSIQKSLEANNKELQQQIATKNKFFSIIAHDLRTPLYAFVGFTELLEEIQTDQKPEVRECANYMKQAADNLFKLLENLLGWARLQMDQMEYTPAKIQLAQIVDDNIGLLSLAASNKEISISHTINGDISVYADIDMLNTVLRNLISQHCIEHIYVSINRYAQYSVAKSDFQRPKVYPNRWRN